MDQELRLEIMYENNLDTDKFARMFSNKVQSYKFYWFESILNLTVTSEEDLSFEEIIDEMICEAWHMVTPYHLKLGPAYSRFSQPAGAEYSASLGHNRWPSITPQGDMFQNETSPFPETPKRETLGVWG